MERAAKFWVLSFSLLAIQSSWADGGSGVRQLQQVSVESVPWTVLAPTVPFENPDGCGVSTVAIIQYADGGSKEKTAAAFLALASGKNVTLFFKGCINTPFNGTAPIVYTVTIIR